MAAVIIVALVAVLAFVQARSQTGAKGQLSTRFQLRADAAASFIEVYAKDVLAREQHLAGERLSAPSVSDAEFAAFLDDFGFGPAVLLDDKGSDLMVVPPNPLVVGTNLTARYAHLKSAHHGSFAVSNVVTSAARHIPVVAFAVPFDTPAGQRVVSGAFDLRSTPMGKYLDNILPSTLGTSALVDANRALIAASRGIAKLDPALIKAIATAKTGTFRSASNRSSYFATSPVGGTPWRLVLSSTTAVLYQPATEAGGTISWLLVAIVACLAGLIAIEFVRSQEARRHLEIVAGQDVLTGLPNRRETQDRMERLLSAARRHQEPISVLLIDIDHFKSVNDRYGHPSGDKALCAVARRIERSVRSEDIAGRWGGEEFLVVLPRTDAAGAAAIAERIRQATSAEQVISDLAPVSVTVSVGAATTIEDEGQLLLSRADAALYQAKTTGRNRVVTAHSLTPPIIPVAPSRP